MQRTLKLEITPHSGKVRDRLLSKFLRTFFTVQCLSIINVLSKQDHMHQDSDCPGTKSGCVEDIISTILPN